LVIFVIVVVMEATTQIIFDCGMIKNVIGTKQSCGNYIKPLRGVIC